MSLTVAVRFHEPSFRRDEVNRYLALPKPARKTSRRVSWPTVRRQLARHGSPGLRVRPHCLDYVTWVLSPDLFLGPDGLFLTSWGHRGRWPSVGTRFLTEGSSNHIHLSDVIPNPVGQFEIGLRAIRNWNQALRQLRGLKRALIYLNGPRAYTLCLYGDPPAAEVVDLENRLPKGSELREMECSDFLRWGLE